MSNFSIQRNCFAALNSHEKSLVLSLIDVSATAPDDFMGSFFTVLHSFAENKNCSNVHLATQQIWGAAYGLLNYAGPVLLSALKEQYDISLLLQAPDQASPNTSLTESIKGWFVNACREGRKLAGQLCKNPSPSRDKTEQKKRLRATQLFYFLFIFFCKNVDMIPDPTGYNCFEILNEFHLKFKNEDDLLEKLFKISNYFYNLIVETPEITTPTFFPQPQKPLSRADSRASSAGSSGGSAAAGHSHPRRVPSAANPSVTKAVEPCASLGSGGGISDPESAATTGSLATRPPASMIGSRPPSPTSSLDHKATLVTGGRTVLSDSETPQE